MTIAADLRDEIWADGDIGVMIGVGPSARIHVNSSPQDSDKPYIWIQRAGHEEPLTLDGSGGLAQERFDLECVSTDVAVAIDLAAKVKKRLHGKRGSFGASTAQGVFVEDKDDQYLPKNIGSDEGLHVASLGLAIWYTT